MVKGPISVRAAEQSSSQSCAKQFLGQSHIFFGQQLSSQQPQAKR